MSTPGRVVHNARAARKNDALAGAGRLVSVNPRGVGGSSTVATPDDLSTRRLVDDLEAVRLALGGEPWVFAGATTGAMVGLQYTLRHPRALTGLIVSGGAPSWRFVEEPSSIYYPSHPRRAALDEAAALLHDPAASGADRRRWSELVIRLSTHKREFLPAFLATGGESTVRPRLRAFGEEIRERSYDVADRLGEIAVPTLILCGRHDPKSPSIRASCCAPASRAPSSSRSKRAGTSRTPRSRRSSGPRCGASSATGTPGVLSRSSPREAASTLLRLS